MQQLHQLAKQHKATKIIKAHVTIGKLSGIVTDSFAFGFEALAPENDLTKDAVLEITETEPVKRCLDCDSVNDITSPACPRCNSTRLIAEGGDDLILTQVEME